MRDQGQQHRIVLYTQGFEPITVVAVPFSALQRLEKMDYIRLMVPLSFNIMAQPVSDDASYAVELKTITLKPHRLMWYGERKLVLTTDDEVDALLMPLEPLPGQVAGIQGYERTISRLSSLLIAALRD